MKSNPGWERSVAIGNATATINAAATPAPYAADPTLTYPEDGGQYQPMVISISVTKEAATATYQWLIGRTMVTAVTIWDEVLGRHPHRTWLRVAAGAKPEVGVSIKPHVYRARGSVYTQALEATDADVERILDLQRMAQKLLGKGDGDGV